MEKIILVAYIFGIVGAAVGLVALCLLIRFLWCVPNDLRRIATATEDIFDKIEK